MIRTTRSLVALSALCLGMGFARTAQAQLAYAIANRSTLISFDLATPGTVTTVGALSGAVAFLDDIDFRPANGLLYGYLQSSNTLVTVNTLTGATTFLNNPSVGLNLTGGGIDFNPAADRLRLVDSSDRNLRLNVDTGVTTTDTDLNYPAGGNPFINDVAYTNNDNDGATGTTLYYIDSNTNSLVTTANPNGGVLTNVGPLGTNQGSQKGFDIFTSAGGTNSAYAILGAAQSPGLYSINLATGAASSLGSISAPAGSNITGFAIRPVALPGVPEPGSIAMLAGLGIVGAGLLRKRRARK